MERDTLLQKKTDMTVERKMVGIVHDSQSTAALQHGVRFTVESEMPSSVTAPKDQQLPRAAATAVDLPCPSTTVPAKPEQECQQRGKSIRVGACFATSQIRQREQSISQGERHLKPAERGKEKGSSEASSRDGGGGTLSQVECSADGVIKVERRMIDFCTSFRHKTKRKEKDSSSKWGVSRLIGCKTEGNSLAGDEVSMKKQYLLDGGGGHGPHAQEGHREGGGGIQNSSAHTRPMGLQLQNVNGRYVVVASSVEVGGRNPADEQQYEEVHEDAAMTATSNSFSDREKTERWQTNETRLFFKSLQQCGTDFSMIEKLFPGRTRKQLKNKFKKEERLRPHLVSMALKSTVPLDALEFEAVLGVPIRTDSTDLGRTDIIVDSGKQDDGNVPKIGHTVGPPK